MRDGATSGVARRDGRDGCYVDLAKGISQEFLGNRMGPPLDSVQLPYKWLNSMISGR